MTRARAAIASGLAVAMFVAGAVLLAADRGISGPRSGGGFSLQQLVASDVVSVEHLDATIAALQERLRASAEDPLALAALGAAYLQKSRTNGDAAYLSLADEALTRSLAVQPGNLPALLGSGELALARHDFENARRWAVRALDVSEVNATALGVLGDAHIGLGNYRRAFRAYQAMANLRPDLASYARVSYARELTGDLSGAINAMQRARMAGAILPENEAWTNNQLGDLYFATGRLNLARLHYRHAIRRVGDFTPALAGLAKVDAAQGFARRAILRLERVVARLPLPQHVIALGDLYAATGKENLAEHQYALVKAQNRIYTANGVLPDVEMTLFFADQGKDPERSLQLARAQWRERRSVQVADAYAWALYRNGRIQAAKSMSRRALRLGTRDAAMIYRSGVIALAVGDDFAARSRLSEALEMNERFSVLLARRARTLLGWLEARL